MILNENAIHALNTGFKAKFQNAFAKSAPQYTKVATVVNSSKAAEDYGWLRADVKMREFVGSRVIQNVSNLKYTIRNRKFEMTVGVPVDAIADDNIGQYGPMMAEMGNAAAMYPDELVFELMKKGTETVGVDGQYFFDTDHAVGGESVSNYTAGSNAAWYLLDCSRPIKPFIFQKRQDPTFVIKGDEKDSNVFERDEILYGAKARGNAGYGLWQMAYCSKADLTTDNFDAAYAAMRSLKGESGLSLNIKPTLLVVPPSLRGKAAKIIKSERLSDNTDNHNYGIVEILEVADLA